MNVTVTCKPKKSAVATGLIAAAFVFSLTDANSVPHSISVPVPSGDQIDNLTAVFDSSQNIPEGDFTGSVQAVTADGVNVGDSLPFASSENDQWVAGSIIQVVVN